MNSIYELLSCNLDGNSSLPRSLSSPLRANLTQAHLKALIIVLLSATDYTNDVFPDIIRMLTYLGAYHKFTLYSWRRATIGCFQIAAKHQQDYPECELDVLTSKATGVYLSVLKRIEVDLLLCFTRTLRCECDSTD